MKVFPLVEMAEKQQVHVGAQPMEANWLRCVQGFTSTGLRARAFPHSYM